MVPRPAPDLAPGREYPAAARARAVDWARDRLNDPATVFLDTETTGFPPSAEVVDLAIVTADGEVLVETLVRPLAPIPPATTAIHGITDQDVAGAPCWLEIHDRVCSALAGRTIIIYNVDFDRRVLRGCSDRHRLTLPEARWECAMAAYADYRHEAAGGNGQRRRYKLEVAAGHFGHPPGGHRALGDALTCLQVVRGMAGLG
jgi:DNA polymerase-3 subunit epsilon